MGQSVAGTHHVALAHVNHIHMSGHHVGHTVLIGIGLANNHLFLRAYGKNAHQGHYRHDPDDGCQSGKQGFIVFFHIFSNL